MWSNPPAAVDALRTMLVACASAISAGLVTAAVHYPDAAAGSDDASTRDTLPRAILAETAHTRRRYAEAGVAGLPGGSLSISLQVDTDPGTLETLARSLADELIAQSTGLPLVSVDVGLCSDPTPGQRAAVDGDATTLAKFRTITLAVEWGLSA